MNKVLKTIIGVVIGIFAIAIIAIVVVSLTSKKLVCESAEGNITIMYNSKTIKGYKAKNMRYDLEGQREYAESIGIEAYLDEFSEWFSNNTTGTCTK